MTYRLLTTFRFRTMYVSFFTNVFLVTFILSIFIGERQCIDCYQIKKLSTISYVSNFKQLSSISSTIETEWQPDFSLYKQDFQNLDASQWDQLENLSIKFCDWNNKVNLVSRKDIQFLIPNHIIPCLSMSLIRNFADGETVIDVGTGGGLPGLPLAIACPNTQFTLIDSNVKKMMVVQDLVDSLGLKNVRVICNRAEKLNENFDFMLGRAVSNLPNFLSFSSHLLDGNSKVPLTLVEQKLISSGVTIGSGLLYLKGGDFSDEIQQAGISTHYLFPVSDMVPSVLSEKFVLYIPSDEIVKSRERMIVEEAKLEEIKVKNNVKNKGQKK